MTLVEGLPGALKRIATGLPIARRASRVPVDRAADAGKLRFYVDILHPTDAHFFHHFIDDMRARGHEFLVASREKECAVDLLDGFGIPHTVASRQAHGTAGLLAELGRRVAFATAAAYRFDPDYLIGLWGPVVAPVSKLVRGRSVVLYDNEAARTVNKTVYRLCDVFCSPRCYQDDAGPHHVRYPGYQQLAYLHPKRFRADASRLAQYGFGEERLFVVRFVSWEAAHDIGDRTAFLSTASGRWSNRSSVAVASSSHPKGRCPPTLSPTACRRQSRRSSTCSPPLTSSLARAPA